jgi:spore germination protein YaaH
MAMERLRRLMAGLLAGAVVLLLIPSGDATATGTALRPLRADQVAVGLSQEVDGFLPYWLATSAALKDLRPDQLSTISLFSVGFASNGTLLRASAGYAFVTSSRGTSVITKAHAAGVRVDITFTSFGMAQNRTLLRDPRARARAIGQAVALMAARGADGAALDFEGLYLKDLPALTAFVRDFGRAARARNPIARVSLTVLADQGGVLQAKAGLAGGADRVVIMGYDYRSPSSSTAGSIDPLVRRGGGMSLTWTLDLYKAAKVPAGRLILALPYYGYTWPTASSAVGVRPARTAYGRAPAYPIRVAHITVPKGVHVGYDPIEATAWMAVYDPRTHVWRQTYWDTPRSLAAKYQLITSRKLAGVGLWALGDETGLSGYWEALAGAFGHGHLPSAPRAATLPPATDPAVTSLTVRWAANLRRWIVSYGATDRTASIVGYEVRYRIGQRGWVTVFYQTTWRSIGLPLSQSAQLTVQVRVRDSRGRLSPWATAQS